MARASPPFSHREGENGDVEDDTSRRSLFSRVLIVSVLVSVIGLLVLFGYGVIRSQSSGGIGVNAVGQIGRIPPGPAPDFRLHLLSGGSFDLARQRGQPVVLNFWASWCELCRDETPALERAWTHFQDRGLVMIGVDVWDDDNDARALVRTDGISFPIGIDTGGHATIDYGITGVPETYFIRPDGTIARHWIGPLTDQQMTVFVEDLLHGQ